MNGHSILTALANRLPAAVDVHLQEVIEGASIAFVIKIIGTVLAFAFNVVLARLLGADGAGVYYLALTVVTIASLLGKVGLDNAFVRFTAANAAHERWDKVAALSRKGVRFSTAISILVSLLIVLLAPWLSNSIFDEPRLVWPLRLIALAIVPFSLLSLNSALLRGLKKIRDATIVRTMAVPLLSLPFLLIFGRLWGIEGAVISYILAVGLVWLFSVAAWRRAAPFPLHTEGHFNTNLLVTTSVPLLWIELLNYTMSSSGTLLLGAWLDSEAVGVYGIALRTTLLMRFIIESANTIVAPKVAALYESNDMASLGALMRNISVFMAAMGAPILLVFFVAPQWILNLFGSDFTGGAAAMAILATGQFINVATGTVGQLLLMTGHEKILRNNFIFNTALNLVLNVILIPAYGIVGAAIASAASLVIQNLITVALVRKYLSISFWAAKAS